MKKIENTKFQENFQKEFQYHDFLTGEEVLPSQSLSKNILKEAKEYLQPSPIRVFKKVFLIHFFASILSLSICPQFGVGLWGGADGLLASWFAPLLDPFLHPMMHYGLVVCAATCGVVFFGISAIFAVFLLRIEELRVIYRKGIWQYSVIAVVSWLLLMMGGDRASLEVASEFASEFTSIWIVSGVISASVILALGTLVKSYKQYELLG